MKRFATLAVLTLLTPVGLLATAGSASATPICESVQTTGVVPHPATGTCVPYNLGTTCLTGSAGLEGTELVYYHICVPSILAE